MNGALTFTIELLILTVGICGAIIATYIALRIVRAIALGKIDPIHLVTDKASNCFSLHKCGQVVGTVAITVAVTYIVTHSHGKEGIGPDTISALAWLIFGYGTITILPQAWTNFLNRNNPPPAAAPKP